MITTLYKQIQKEEAEAKDEKMRTLLISGNKIKKFQINFPNIDFSIYDGNFIKVIPDNWETNLKIVEVLKDD